MHLAKSRRAVKDLGMMDETLVWPDETKQKKTRLGIMTEGSAALHQHDAIVR